MSKKDLIQNSSSNSQLAVHYAAAHKQLLGVSVRVPPNYMGKFAVFEDDLREFGIPSRDYAYNVVGVMKKWLMDKGLGYVPINVFLSNFAISKFLKVYQSTEVDVLADKGDLIHSELLVSRRYIEANKKGVVKFRVIVEELKPLLSEDWLELYYQGGSRPEIEALDILCEEYNVSAYTITDIVDAI